MDYEPQVALLSDDGVKFCVKSQCINMSGLIKDIIEDTGMEDLITLPNVSAHALQKIIEYCEYHWNNRAAEIVKPLKGRVEDVICDFDKRFLEMEIRLLIEVIMATRYLVIPDLLDLTCAKVASNLLGKSPVQIRELLGIENDFSPEEEAQIREENQWCQDM